VFGTVYFQPPPEEFPSEKHMEERLVREVLAVFDPALWDLSLEKQGGILFFHVRRALKN